MQRNLVNLAKPFLFVALFIGIYLISPLLLTFAIGGVITQGILGGFTGKVGPVVGGKWKDVDYMRSYVIPSNPNSTDQQTQRSRFVIIQDYARQVLSTLIQPYWDPFYSSMSGYNAFMQELLLNAPASNLLTSAVKIAKGTLASVSITSATYNTGDGTCTLVISSALVGNQLLTDVPHLFVFDKSTGLIYYFDPANTRDDGGFWVTLPTGLTPSNLEVFVFFSQGSGSSMIVSDSAHITASAS